VPGVTTANQTTDTATASTASSSSTSSSTGSPSTGTDSTGANSTGANSTWGAFAVCISVDALTMLDLSGVNVALPSIEKSVGANSTQLQLIVAGYTLAFGLSLVPSGRLGDIRSRRTMFIVGLSAFVVASALCAVAPNNVWLTIARIIQGAAAGIQMPQVLGMIQQLFQGEARGRAFGIFGAMVGIATALGPTLGGLLIGVGSADMGWRYLFMLNVPLGILSLIFAIRLLPRHQDRDERDKGLDPFGIVLIGAAIVCFMLPFLFTTGRSSDDPYRWFSLAGFVVLTVSFLWWERRYKRRGKSPIVHFELFRFHSYRNGLIVAMVWFAALPASFLITTLYLQDGLRATPLLAGLVTVPFALSSGVAAWFGGRLVNRYGRSLVVSGIVIAVVGISLVLAAATLTPSNTTEWYMAGALLISGIGGGLVISPNQTLTLAEVPLTKASAAGSMAQLGQRIGTAVGVSAVTAVFFAAITANRGTSHLADYRMAFRDGYLVTLGLLTVCLVIALVDLRIRKTAAQADRVG
jgi:EmrB/QacA subfamily drug resistance transporter